MDKTNDEKQFDEMMRRAIILGLEIGNIAYHAKNRSRPEDDRVSEDDRRHDAAMRRAQILGIELGNYNFLTQERS